MSIRYITTGERIDGSNAPDNRPDVLNRPIQELLTGLNNGDITTSSKNILYDATNYTIDLDVQTDDLVYLDNLTIKKSTPNNTSIGIINENNKIILYGLYTFLNRNDLIVGTKYFVSKTIPGFIVPESSADASGIFIGIAINSNEMILNIEYNVLDENTAQNILDNINSININANNIDSINTNANNIFDINVISDDLSNQFSYVEDYGSIEDPVESGIGTSKIAIVADNIDNVNLVADNISNGWTGTIVAGNTITVVNGIITDVI